MKFTYRNPTRIIFGIGEFEQLGSEAATIGRHALLVTGKSSARKLGFTERAKRLLQAAGVEITLFEEIEPNPRTTTIERAADLVREQGCDFVIGLGGGSPMDSAKGIAVAASNDGPFWDYVSHGDPDNQRQPQRALPIVTVPTLAATGSEANCGGVFTNWESNEKAALFNPLVYPVFTVIDPQLTVAVSPEYTGDGGVDIISHCLERYFSSAVQTPVQDSFIEGVVRAVMSYLGRAMQDGSDLEARTHLSWASTVALQGLVGAGKLGGFPLHAMEHALSAHYDISHGRGLAILFPHLMRFTAEKFPEQYATFAKHVFFKNTDGMTISEAAEQGISLFEDWLDSVGMKLRLSDVGIGAERIERMADDVLRVNGSDGVLANRRPMKRGDIISVYRAAL
ncbi:MAG: iron-containing alcohol dehydrogenase [bacterium]